MRWFDSTQTQKHLSAVNIMDKWISCFGSGVAVIPRFCLGLALLLYSAGGTLLAAEAPAPPTNICIKINGVEKCSSQAFSPEKNRPSPVNEEPPKENQPGPVDEEPPKSNQPDPVDGGSPTYGEYPASVTDPSSFHPGYFLIVGDRDSISEFNKIKDVPAFVGIKKIYSWKKLEPRKGVYDFSEIERDLEYLQSIGKRLWLQIKETQYFAKYQPHVPEYMWNDPKYGCGTPSPDGRRFYGTFWRDVHDGHWVVCRGDEDFDERHRALYTALGNRFDGEPFIEGVTLDETSTGLNPNGVDVIYEAFKELGLATKRAFPSKVVSQMINYAPFDLNDFAEFLRSNGIATTGPDVIPTRADSSLKTAYAIHKRNHRYTPNSIDIQWSNWDRYTEKPYTSQQLLDFAIERINPWYVFWAQNPDYLESQTIPTIMNNPLPAAEGFYNR